MTHLPKSASPSEPRPECIECKKSPCECPGNWEDFKPTPKPFPHFPSPWKFAEEGYNGGPGVLDRKGGIIAALFWPTHPPEETEAVEKETYALGKAIANLGKAAEPRRDEREMFDDFLKDAPIDLAHRISIMGHSYAFQFWQAARASAAPLNQEDEDRSKVAGRAKLLMKFYVAMHEAGIKSNWEAQERISIDELAELMSKEEPRK